MRSGTAVPSSARWQACRRTGCRLGRRPPTRAATAGLPTLSQVLGDRRRCACCARLSVGAARGRVSSRCLLVLHANRCRLARSGPRGSAEAADKNPVAATMLAQCSGTGFPLQPTQPERLARTLRVVTARRSRAAPPGPGPLALVARTGDAGFARRSRRPPRPAGACPLDRSGSSWDNIPHCVPRAVDWCSPAVGGDRPCLRPTSPLSTRTG